jgi:hypothetical protein
MMHHPWNLTFIKMGAKPGALGVQASQQQEIKCWVNKMEITLSGDPGQ